MHHICPQRCDVPLDVVKSVVTTGTVDDGRFALDGSSTIVQNGTAEVLEDVDGEGNDPADDTWSRTSCQDWEQEVWSGMGVTLA